MTRASGVGSWPGTNPAEANGTIRNALADSGIPFLAELPARGPGADIIGRGAALLVDLPVELTPSGWRHADAPGRDARRASAYLGNDLDALAEAYDGYDGELKIQLAGPWTLAASIELPRGERTLTDPGAVADLVASLAEGARVYAAEVARLVPQARLIVQIDEPSLPAVLAGRLPTASGYGRVRAVDPQVVEAGLATVVAALADHRPVIHCLDPEIPLPLVRRAGARGIGLDVTALSPHAWESVATAVEDGVTIHAGAVPTHGGGRHTDAVAVIADGWRRVGLEEARLDDLVVMPTSGLAGVSPDLAARLVSVCRDVAAALTERAHS